MGPSTRGALAESSADGAVRAAHGGLQTRHLPSVGHSWSGRGSPFAKGSARVQSRCRFLSSGKLSPVRQHGMCASVAGLAQGVGLESQSSLTAASKRGREDFGNCFCSASRRICPAPSHGGHPHPPGRWRALTCVAHLCSSVQETGKVAGAQDLGHRAFRLPCEGAMRGASRASSHVPEPPNPRDMRTVPSVLREPHTHPRGVATAVHQCRCADISFLLMMRQRQADRLLSPP